MRKIRTGNENIQFKRICNNLNIKIITTSVPQAKGRVERLNQTFQDRLNSELRSHKIDTIEEANKYLIEVFTPNHNKRFSLPINKDKIAFRPLPKNFYMPLELSICYIRKMLDGNVISFKGSLYKLISEEGKEARFDNKQEILVREILDGNLIAEKDGFYYKMKFFKKNSNPRSIPPVINHPWKIDNGKMFIKNTLKERHFNF
jgi:hypothetical protein